MLDGMSDSIQRSRIENLNSREVDRQSPMGLILFQILLLSYISLCLYFFFIVLSIVYDMYALSFGVTKNNNQMTVVLQHCRSVLVWITSLLDKHGQTQVHSTSLCRDHAATSLIQRAHSQYCTINVQITVSAVFCFVIIALHPSSDVVWSTKVESQVRVFESLWFKWF